MLASDPQSLLCDPGEASGKRGDPDQWVLHHRELQGLHHAASFRHQAHRAEENGGYVAGDETSLFFICSQHTFVT